MAHPLFTLLAAIFVSAALSMDGIRSPRQRLHEAGRTFFCCLTCVVGGGWLMHFIHG